MKKFYINLLLIFTPITRRNYNRLIRRYNILYNTDKIKNKYKLFNICSKLADYTSDYDDLIEIRRLLYKTFNI